MTKKLCTLFTQIFIKKQKYEKQPSSTLINDAGYYFPKSADDLLNSPLRQQLLTTIWQNVSMSQAMFEQLYHQPIKKFAEIAQLLPASESHHHSHLGGMLDHNLEVISMAVKLRQSYVLPPNVAPEEQAKQRDIWTAVVIYAALLHDVGKIAADIEIILESGERWFPWHGKPTQPYRFRYIQDRDYRLHPVLGSFFFTQLISQEALNWLANFKEAFSSLLFFSAGHNTNAGVLAEIIQKADQYSVTLALGGDIAKLDEKPTIPFAKQLIIALRHVVQSMKLNTQQGGGSGWLTEQGLWVMSKTTVDGIRAYLMQQGVAVPSQNGKVFDELQAHQLIDVTPDNMAIWHTKVTSNSGWTHKDSFKLLRIPPNIIWENIEQRPTLFEGRVEVVITETGAQSEENNAIFLINNSTVSKTDLSDNANSVPAEEDSKPETKTIVDAIPSPSNNEVDATDFVVGLFQDNHPAIAQEESVEAVYSELSSETEQNDNISILVAQPNQTGTVSEKRAQSTEKKQKKTANYITNKGENQITNSVSTLDLQDANAFVQWVKTNVLSGKLLINKPNAKLHIVEDHLFLVTPSIFQLYLYDVAQSQEKSKWELVQKQFQTLGLHKRRYTQNDSWNIWTCSVVGPNRNSVLKGYLIDNIPLFLGNRTVINNQWLQLQGEIQ